MVTMATNAIIKLVCTTQTKQKTVAGGTPEDSISYKHRFKLVIGYLTSVTNFLRCSRVMPCAGDSD